MPPPRLPPTSIASFTSLKSYGTNKKDTWSQYSFPEYVQRLNIERIFPELFLQRMAQTACLISLRGGDIRISPSNITFNHLRLVTVKAIDGFLFTGSLRSKLKGLNPWRAFQYRFAAETSKGIKAIGLEPRILSPTCSREPHATV